MIVLYHLWFAISAQSIFSDSPTMSSQMMALPEVLGVVGMSIFFFVSGFSLFLNHKTINNRRDAFHFYKKRAVRIYPLYWLFLIGLLIVYRPSFSETLIYIVGLQAFFFPVFVSAPIYHFISVILIFYLLFPFIVYFEDFKKMLIMSLIPLLFLAMIKLQYGLSDEMFLGYYGLFVGGIIAGKWDVYNKLRRTKVKQYFLFTIPLVVALLSLWIITERYVKFFMLNEFLNNLFGISIVLIVFFWAICYVKVFNTKFFAFFTFVAFSTYGVFFLNMPFFVRLSNILNIRFDMTTSATALILAAFIPFLVIAGYLLQFIANEIVDVPKLSQKLS